MPDAGVVNEDVNAPVRFENLRDGQLARSGSGDIERAECAAAAVFLDERERRVRAAAKIDERVMTGGGERQRDDATDAATRAGDESNFFVHFRETARVPCYRRSQTCQRGARCPGRRFIA